MVTYNEHDIKADFFAFSDQDDIWNEDKLSNRMKLILDTSNKFSLYCSRTEIINKKGTFLGYSPLFRMKPSIRNALVQSLAGGNTMIFNNKLREELKNIKYNSDIVAHDWLIYQITCGLGGNVIYDHNPSLKYRQHEKNLIGSNQGIIARVIRIRKLLNGSFKKWNDSNIKILTSFKHKFTNEALEEIDHFKNLRLNYVYKIKNLFNLRIYRQTASGNIALIISVFLNKL